VAAPSEPCVSIPHAAGSNGGGTVKPKTENLLGILMGIVMLGVWIWALIFNQFIVCVVMVVLAILSVGKVLMGQPGL